MKIKIMRKSSKPLVLEQLQKYDTEYKATFDRLAAKHSNVPEDTPHDQIHWGKVDRLAFAAELEASVEQLRKQFVFVDSVELPKSKRSWNALLRQYDGPIMIANTVDNPDEAVLLVMDED